MSQPDEQRIAASESGVDGTTAASRLVNEGAEAGVAPGERQDARPGDTPKVGDARSAAKRQEWPHVEAPELGTHATVFVDAEVGEPHWIGDDQELRQQLRDLVGPTDDFNVVSVYTLHVALYALQNPTPENIRKALYLIGTSGDCEEATDEETLMPLPQPMPNGWTKAWIPEELR